MGHGHAHPAPPSWNRAFALGIALNVALVVAEGWWGWKVQSLALIADAGHNLSDVLALMLAWGAAVLSGTRQTERRTYGLRRATILAALVSAVLLLVALAGIAWEALARLRQPAHVDGMTVIVVAAIGVVINTLTALLFLRGHEDLNIRGAFLHMAADAAVSLGVVVAGVGMMTLGWLWLDPVVSLAIVSVVLIASWGLFRDSFDLALDVVPRGIDPSAVRGFLLDRPGVEDVHDLHIWGLSTTQVALTAHLVVPEAAGDEFLSHLDHALEQRFGIHHSTIQIERGDPEFPCHRDGECS